MTGSSAPRDFYDILGVSRDADADVIKGAYRKMAKKFHPDLNQGDKESEEKLKEATAAYSVLSDPEKRAKYDRFGHQAYGSGGAGFGDMEDIFSQFGDIFGDFFGGGQGRSRSGRAQGNQRRKGADLRYITEVTLKEVVTGAEREIEFEADESCSECTGTGAEKGSQIETCTTCRGSGQVVTRQGFFQMATTCPGCRGQGQTIRNKCGKCGGKGRLSRSRKIRVTIPPGVDSGTRLRVAGEGEGGYASGQSGDLYVEMRVKEDERFERRENDVVSPLPVSYIQAILGGDLEAETLTGQTKVTVPRGSQGGDLIRVSNEGIPTLRGGRRGDLYYQVQIDIPKKLDSEEEKLLKKIAEIRAEKVVKRRFF